MILCLKEGQDVSQVIVGLDAGVKARRRGPLISGEAGSQCFDFSGVGDPAIPNLGNDDQCRRPELIGILDPDRSGPSAQQGPQVTHLAFRHSVTCGRFKNQISKFRLRDRYGDTQHPCTLEHSRDVVVQVQHAAAANANPLEAAIPVQKAMIGDRDLCLIVLDELTVQIEPHRVRLIDWKIRTWMIRDYPASPLCDNTAISLKPPHDRYFRHRELFWAIKFTKLLWLVAAVRKSLAKIEESKDTPETSV